MDVIVLATVTYSTPDDIILELKRFIRPFIVWNTQKSAAIHPDMDFDGWMLEHGITGVPGITNLFEREAIPYFLISGHYCSEKVLGVTGIFPFEIQASNDMLRTRRHFPNLQILGSVDKRIFMADKNESDIDNEIEVTEVLLKQGGCIPHADHHIPDDSCWKNFSIYRNRLNEIIDKSIQ